MPQRRCGILIAALGLLALGRAPALAGSQASPTWNMEVIQSPGDVGDWCSLAIDSSLVPHVAYYDFDRKDLRYATKIGGVWVSELIDSTGDVGRYTSIQIGPGGVPHIAYHDQTNARLKYAFKQGSSWWIELVDQSFGSLGTRPSLRFDNNWVPSIAYYYAQTGDLRFAQRPFGSWNIQTADASGNVGTYASLRFDASNEPHVSYGRAAGPDLMYARRQAGVWNVQTVDTLGQTGFYSSLVLDSADRPIITSYNLTFTGLRYAQFDGVSWAIGWVDSAGSVGDFGSLALDVAGRPTVAYHANDIGTGDLRVAVKLPGGWVATTIDSAGDVGYYPSLVITSDNILRLCFYDNTEHIPYYGTTVVGSAECTPSFAWHRGPSIKIDQPITWWPNGQTLDTMRPNDVIAFTIRTHDDDFLTTTCVDCFDRPRTVKFGPYGDVLEYDWQLLPNSEGKLIKAPTAYGNTVLYQIPKCWPIGGSTKTAEISLTITNPAGKAADLPLVFLIDVSTQDACSETNEQGLKVTIEVSGTVSPPDTPVPEGGSGSCIPVDPTWTVGPLLTETNAVATDPTEFCPDYLTLVSISGSDADNVTLMCLDPNPDPPCPAGIIQTSSNDEIDYTWTIKSGVGSFPLGNKGAAVAVRRSKSSPVVVECTVSDTHKQASDPFKKEETTRVAAKRVRALVGRGDNSAGVVYGVPLSFPSLTSATRIAMFKYNDAGYDVTGTYELTNDKIQLALQDPCVQALWMVGHGGTGEIQLTAGPPPTVFEDVQLPLYAQSLHGCPANSKFPFLRELVVLGCWTYSRDWSANTVCCRVHSFKYSFGPTLVGIPCPWEPDPNSWERDDHVVLPPHDLTLD